MFIVEVPYFNLDQIYNSGQAPRWIKLKEGKYVIPFRDKALKIEQQRDRYDWNKYRLFLSCSEEEFFNTWFEYFDLRTDYLDLNTKVKNLGGKFKIPANRGTGIHILKQDAFEAYVLGNLITNAGYMRAHIAMNHIAEVCGIKHVQSMREAGRIIWYEFPTPEMILENFDKLGKMGKMNSWLKKACQAIINNKLNIFDDVIGSDNKLLKLLVLHKMDVFPLDEIKNTIIKNFDCIPEEFEDWYLYGFESKAIIYMYIIYHLKNSSILRGVI